MHSMASEVAASATVECMTSGAITPATTPLATLPTTACSDEAMPRRSGCRSSTISVTTGTFSAHPKANTAIGASAHQACGVNTRFAARLRMPVANITTKPWRTWCRGGMRPASRPLTQAPAMMPVMVSRKNQKNCVGPRPRWWPRNSGAASTYRNMPLNGTPLAKASSTKRGSESSCE